LLNISGARAGTPKTMAAWPTPKNGQMARWKRISRAGYIKAAGYLLRIGARRQFQLSPDRQLVMFLN
jgi:hypothetical protein